MGEAVCPVLRPPASGGVGGSRGAGVSDGPGGGAAFGAGDAGAGIGRVAVLVQGGAWPAAQWCGSGAESTRALAVAGGVDAGGGAAGAGADERVAAAGWVALIRQRHAAAGVPDVAGQGSGRSAGRGP